MQIVIITTPLVFLLSYLMAKIFEPKENKEACERTAREVERTRKICEERGLL